MGFWNFEKMKRNKVKYAVDKKVDFINGVDTDLISVVGTKVSENGRLKITTVDLSSKIETFEIPNSELMRAECQFNGVKSGNNFYMTLGVTDGTNYIKFTSSSNVVSYASTNYETSLGGVTTTGIISTNYNINGACKHYNNYGIEFDSMEKKIYLKSGDGVLGYLDIDTTAFGNLKFFVEVKPTSTTDISYVVGQVNVKLGY